MSDAIVPFSKFDEKPSDGSWVILRLCVSRLDLVPNDDIEAYFQHPGHFELSEPTEPMDTFEDPLAEEDPRRPTNGQRLREAAAAMLLIAIAIVGAGLWSRSEANAARQELSVVAQQTPTAALENGTAPAQPSGIPPILMVPSALESAHVFASNDGALPARKISPALRHHAARTSHARVHATTR
jgi:hypothetical protein